jgi:hypothetical protein
MAILPINKVFHPVTGEEGFFCSKLEKQVIDAIVLEFKTALYEQNSPRSLECGGRNG